MMHEIPLARWQSNVLSGREPESDGPEHHEPELPAEAACDAAPPSQPFSSAASSHTLHDASYVGERGIFSAPSITRNLNQSSPSIVESDPISCENAVSTTIATTHLLFEKPDVYEPDEGLFHQMQPPMPDPVWVQTLSSTQPFFHIPAA